MDWARYDLSASANADFARAYHVRAQGQPIDMTGWAFSFELRAQPNQSGTPLLTLAGPTAGGNGIRATAEDLATGTFQIFIHRLTINPLRGPDPFASRELWHDIIATLPDGHTARLWFGEFRIFPGVTRP